MKNDRMRIVLPVNLLPVAEDLVTIHFPVHESEAHIAGDCVTFPSLVPFTLWAPFRAVVLPWCLPETTLPSW